MKRRSAKRGPRRYGFPADRHQNVAASEFQDAKNAAGDVVRAVESGDCSQAFEHLTVAERALGAGAAHEVSASTRNRFSAAAFEAVSRAEGKFAAACRIRDTRGTKR